MSAIKLKLIFSPTNRNECDEAPTQVQVCGAKSRLPKLVEIHSIRRRAV